MSALASAACLALAALAGSGAQAQVPAGAAASAPAATPMPLPAEQFFMQPELAQPLLSPSGRFLAVLARGGSDRNLLAVVDLEQGGKAGVVARFSDADIRNVHWVGDERLLFDIIDLQRAGGDQRWAPGLFSVQRDGTGLRQLVKLRSEFLREIPPAGMDRRLDSNHVLLQVPQLRQPGDNEVLVGEVNGDNRGGVLSVVPKRLDVATGRTRSLLLGGPSRVMQWMFDPAGEARVAVSQAEGRTRVHWRAPGSDAWAVISDAPSLEQPWSPHSVDASGSLFVLVGRGAGGTSVLTRFDFASGKPQPAPMVNTPGFDFRGSLITDWHTGKTLGVRANTDAETTVWLEPRMQALQTEMDAALPGRVNRITCRQCMDDKGEKSDKGVALVESHADRDPGSFWVWRAATRQLDLVGRSRRNIDPARMASVDFQRFSARDGRSIPVWVTRPAGTVPGTPLPAIVLVHGGPWVRGGHWGWQPMQQFLASRGYAVIEPEFRGSSGFGWSHFRAGWRQWGQAMQDDVADAVQWATRNKTIDAARVCIAGASYGGYATLMGLVRDPDLYRCGAAWVAVADPMRLLERSWFTADDISDESRRYGLPVLLGDVEKDAAMLKAASPLEQAERIRAPLLLAYGGMDLRVPVAHGSDLRAAMRKFGREPDWVVYPGEAHGWRKLDNQVDFAQRLEAFFAKHLR
jgi:acetyl esterase/lipase